MKGGYRQNAGRKPNSGRYGEPTMVMRVPVSLVAWVRSFIELACGWPVPRKIVRELRMIVNQEKEG